MEPSKPIDPKYSTKVAYFNMEFAIHPALKTYAGGLGFLAGSHMRSAHKLGQNMVGVGILWSYGYYDQERAEDGSLKPVFMRKYYYFLEDTGIKVSVEIDKKPVFVKAMRLSSKTFGSAPVYFLTTDIPENDFLSRTITHKLYDSNEETRVAQEIVLGIGGAKVLDAMGENVEVYHMNEGHALPLAFYLYSRYKDANEVKKRLVLTSHTPERSGNEEHNIRLLEKMGFFDGVSLETARNLVGAGTETLCLTVGALRLAKITNAVSKMHLKTSQQMWGRYDNISPIISITNGQSFDYWADKELWAALMEQNEERFVKRKKELKNVLFDIVAVQTGKLFDPDVLTIVWARRFVEYKRPALLKRDFERFKNLVGRSDRPVQVIWAGKPYPSDYSAINLFNELVYTTRDLTRVAVLTGYELYLSRRLKKGADLWINTPRITREACGTSGMSAAMNAAVNLSTPDGWFPEFVKNKINGFVIPPVDPNLSPDEQDAIDAKNMMDILENEIIPLYYDQPDRWAQIVKQSMKDVVPYFDSDRMAAEYYDKMYNYKP